MNEIEINEKGTIIINAKVTRSVLASHFLVKENIPILSEATKKVIAAETKSENVLSDDICGGGTVGYHISSLFVLNAKLVFEEGREEHTIPIESFFRSNGKAIPKNKSMLKEIVIERDDYIGFAGHCIHYDNMSHGKDMATLGCTCLVKLTEDKEYLEEIRLAYTVSDPRPIRCNEIEEEVRNMKVGKELQDVVGKGALREINPRTSWRAVREFRYRLIEELAKKTLEISILKSGGFI